MAQAELKDRRDRMAHREIKGLKETQGLLDLRVLVELKDHRETKDLEDGVIQE